MGIFYERVPTYEAASDEIKKAFMETPPGDIEIVKKTEESAKEVSKKVAGKFSWKRLGMAIGLLFFLLLLALYTGRIDDYNILYEMLVDKIDIVFGGIIGIILGEYASK